MIDFFERPALPTPLPTLHNERVRNFLKVHAPLCKEKDHVPMAQGPREALPTTFKAYIIISKYVLVDRKDIAVPRGFEQRGEQEREGRKHLHASHRQSLEDFRRPLFGSLW